MPMVAAAQQTVGSHCRAAQQGPVKCCLDSGGSQKAHVFKQKTPVVNDGQRLQARAAGPTGCCALRGAWQY